MLKKLLEQERHISAESNRLREEERTRANRLEIELEEKRKRIETLESALDSAINELEHWPGIVKFVEWLKWVLNNE
jgi:predicted RNase H-like nuclease (RuvC/YqgF family)